MLTKTCLGYLLLLSFPFGKFLRPTCCCILYMPVQRQNKFRWLEALTNLRDNPQIGSEVITKEHTRGHTDNVIPYLGKNVSWSICSVIQCEKFQMQELILTLHFTRCTSRLWLAMWWTMSFVEILSFMYENYLIFHVIFNCKSVTPESVPINPSVKALIWL
jgi:hypothetical protein